MRDRTLRRMVFTGVMAAFVFVATYLLKIRIPTPTGYTMIKTGNILCLLSGLLFGPVCGGLASGIGSALYDLTDPAYATSAPITFVLFFAMGFLCGLISHRRGAHGLNRRRNILAAAVAALSYVALYAAKSVLTLVIAGSSVPAAIVANSTKIITSLVNACIAVPCSLLLAAPVRRALKHIDY